MATADAATAAHDTAAPPERVGGLLLGHAGGHDAHDLNVGVRAAPE